VAARHSNIGTQNLNPLQNNWKWRRTCKS